MNPQQSNHDRLAGFILSALRMIGLVMLASVAIGGAAGLVAGFTTAHDQTQDAQQ